MLYTFMLSKSPLCMAFGNIPNIQKVEGVHVDSGVLYSDVICFRHETGQSTMAGPETYLSVGIEIIHSPFEPLAVKGLPVIDYRLVC